MKRTTQHKSDLAVVFETTADLVDRAAAYVAGPPSSGTVSAQKWHDRAREHAGQGRTGFFGTGAATLAAVPALERAEPPAVIEEKARELESRIEEGDTATAGRRAWIRADEGEINPARLADALAGNPAPRLFDRRRRIRQPQKLATVVFSSLLPAHSSPRDFAKRGAACAAAASALEARGYSVALYVESTARANEGNVITAYWPAKRHGEPLDLSAVWYAVRPEVSRRAAIIATNELFAKSGNRYDPGHGHCYDAGKTAACAALDIPEDTTIYLSFSLDEYEIERAILSGVARMIEAAAVA